MKTQNEIIASLNVKPEINPTEEIRTRIDFLKTYCKQAGAKGFVLGISGGQDSTLAGRLSQLAVEELRVEGYEATFIALRLPYGVQKDEVDAQEALVFIQPDQRMTINIESTVNAFTMQYDLSHTGSSLGDYHKGNVKARVRMMTQYAVAGEYNALVIGTDHAAEAVTGFFTKFGDGGADILPISGLTKRQGKALLQELQAPEVLYLKVPTADLLDNVPQQADETELGITYAVLDDFLEGKTVEANAQEKIEKRFNVTEHKRQAPVSPVDNWWKYL